MFQMDFHINYLTNLRNDESRGLPETSAKQLQKTATGFGATYRYTFISRTTDARVWEACDHVRALANAHLPFPHMYYKLMKKFSHLLSRVTFRMGKCASKKLFVARFSFPVRGIGHAGEVSLLRPFVPSAAISSSPLTPLSWVTALHALYRTFYCFRTFCVDLKHIFHAQGVQK